MIEDIFDNLEIMLNTDITPWVSVGDVVVLVVMVIAIVDAFFAIYRS